MGNPEHSALSRRCGPRASLAGLAALVLAIAGVATATAQPANVEAPATDAAQSEPEPLYAAPTRENHSGRIHASVEINGKGPFRFILDTGANSSALTPRIVEELALPLVEAGVVRVHGVTGAANLPAVHVERMRAGNIEFPPSALPVLAGDIFEGADGILGVAGIQEMRIDVDFVRNRVEIGPSSGKRAPTGYVTVPASMWHGGLMLVKGRVGRIPAKVIIDTGAEHTMGNLELRAAILAKSRRSKEFDTTVHGATPVVGAGKVFVAPRISIGPAQLVDLPVTFGDLHVFNVWGLASEPALVVGMDVLGRLEHFVVDYQRKEFQMKSTGKQGSVAIRRCTVSTCGSRIPEKPYQL